MNSAPVLDNTGSPTLDPISINAESETNIGTLVSDLLARMEPLGGVTDSDPGASLGIAINGLTGATNGTWEFTVNGGTNWTPVGTTGNGDARLLAADGNTRVRFVPNAGFVGEAKFSFVVWDRTAGANGGTASVNNRGGATPFSLAYEYASIRVVNNAPVLTVSATSSLDAIPVDVPDVSNPGTSISDLIARMGPSGGITDADPGALSGIAVVGMTGTANGTWQYTIDAGANWSALGATGSINARLLAADANTRIRFVPNSGFTGIAKIAFVAWDQTSGVNGALVNAGNRGGTTAFSTVYDYAKIEVLPEFV